MFYGCGELVADPFWDNGGMLVSDCGGSSGAHARICSFLPAPAGLYRVHGGGESVHQEDGLGPAGRPGHAPRDRLRAADRMNEGRLRNP